MNDFATQYALLSQSPMFRVDPVPTFTGGLLGDPQQAAPYGAGAGRYAGGGLGLITDIPKVPDVGQWFKPGKFGLPSSQAPGLTGDTSSGTSEGGGGADGGLSSVGWGGQSTTNGLSYGGSNISASSLAKGGMMLGGPMAAALAYLGAPLANAMMNQAEDASRESALEAFNAQMALQAPTDAQVFADSQAAAQAAADAVADSLSGTNLSADAISQAQDNAGMAVLGGMEMGSAVAAATAAALAGATTGAEADAAMGDASAEAGAINGGYDGAAATAAGTDFGGGDTSGGGTYGGYSGGDLGGYGAGGGEIGGYAASDSGASTGDSGGGGGGGGGGGKIICTELHRQGLMPRDIYEADQAFGRQLLKNDPDALHGYHRWATWVVAQMQRTDWKGRAVTQIARWIATPWSLEMARRMGLPVKRTVAGWLLMEGGLRLCRLVAPKRCEVLA